MRELPEKRRLLQKPNTLVSIVFLLVFFLVAVFLAITQEAGDVENPSRGDFSGAVSAPEDEEEGFEPEFIPAGPPRWFRSNAGGMALEEIPSRLGALRNQYALVIDYVPPDELDSRITPFSKDDYIIEIRILYKDRKEIRKQWLLRDESGNTRVNAVFRPVQDEEEPVPDASVPAAPVPAAPVQEEAVADAPVDESGEPALADAEGAPSAEAEVALAETAPSAESAPSVETAPSVEGAPAVEGAASGSRAAENKMPSGFIEVYNENGQIAKDYSFFEGGAEILIEYFYKGSSLIRAETKRRDSEAEEYRKAHTDNYRYNRSYSLRHVERVFHEAADIEPVRIVFPGRVIEAAYEKDFMKEKLSLSSDFFGGLMVDDGYRMVYDTDSKGRVLGETLYDSNDEVVWKVKNTWVGDRITAILKIEGEEERLTEYDYDGSGGRIAERDIRNGVLERQVLINGSKETEELYLDGVIVLRAFWEDGRKISEERVRRR